MTAAAPGQRRAGVPARDQSRAEPRAAAAEPGELGEDLPFEVGLSIGRHQARRSAWEIGPGEQIRGDAGSMPCGASSWSCRSRVRGLRRGPGCARWTAIRTSSQRATPGSTVLSPASHRRTVFRCSPVRRTSSRSDHPNVSRQRDRRYGDIDGTADGMCPFWTREPFGVGVRGV